MPLAKTKPMRFRPRSLSDTLDGDNSASGACGSLANLIQDPTTPSVLQCRPAVIDLSLFAGFMSPQVVSAAWQVNNRVYGLIGSSLNAGKDQPFCFDLVAQDFVTVQGVNNGNCPFTQPTTGDWTPPTAIVVGTRVIFTHPGFVGVGSNVFGYFDISNYTDAQNGNIASSSNQVTGNISIGAVGPGYLISGAGIPSNTTVTNVVNVTPQSTGDTHSNTTLDNVAVIAGFAPGQPISGLGIATGTTIASISGTTITLSQAATATADGVTISATGTVITMSANATATTVLEAITIVGGTIGSPLWAAGNTTNVPLIGVPSNVSTFNNRAYFSNEQYLTFTDPLSLNISQAEGQVQTLTIGDVSPITALEPLTIINPATTAPVAGLLVFKEELISLVTGDPTTSNLAVSTISSQGIGTTSPLAVCATSVGVAFPAADGIRYIELSGNVSDPLPDVRVPIIYAINRTRMCGAYNAGVYRICLQNGFATGTPFQEFWFNLTYKLWTGPHTFQPSILLPWQGTFIAFSNAVPATLYQSDPVQTLTSNFEENGLPLAFTYATCAMPDNEDLMYNSLVVSSLNVAFKSGAPSLTCTATDEDGTVVGLASITTPGAASFWGSMIWGTNVWYGQQYGLRAHQIPWTALVVFSKLILTVQAQSSLGFQISNFQALYQPLGYVSTPVGVTVNSAPPTPPPLISFLWDAGYNWDSGINWQG